MWHAEFSLTAVSSCSIAAPLLLSLPLPLLLVSVLRSPGILLGWLACVWMWILCPELTSVTIRTQLNSTACSQKHQPASSPDQVGPHRNRLTTRTVQIHISTTHNTGRDATYSIEIDLILTVTDTQTDSQHTVIDTQRIDTTQIHSNRQKTHRRHTQTCRTEISDVVLRWLLVRFVLTSFQLSWPLCHR